jgi:hypothetical protein
VVARFLGSYASWACAAGAARVVGHSHSATAISAIYAAAADLVGLVMIVFGRGGGVQGGWGDEAAGASTQLRDDPPGREPSRCHPAGPPPQPPPRLHLTNYSRLHA